MGRRAWGLKGVSPHNGEAKSPAWVLTQRAARVQSSKSCVTPDLLGSDPHPDPSTVLSKAQVGSPDLESWV